MRPSLDITHSQSLILLSDLNHSYLLVCISNNFVIQVRSEPMTGAALLNLLFTKKDRARIRRSGSVLAAKTMRWWSSGAWEKGEELKTGLQSWTWKGGFALCRDLLGRITWDMALERSPRETIDLQGSLFSGFLMIHFSKQEIKWRQQGSCMWRMSSWLNSEETKRKYAGGRSRSGDQGEYRRCWSMQGWDEESQSPPGIESGEWCKRCLEKILQICQQQKKD